MLTKGGYIKKTELAAFSNIRANGLIAISLEEGDQLRWVRRARAEDSIIIGSRQGMAIRFRTDNEQLRPLGRATRGVRSMSLREGDELISMDILPSSVLSVKDLGSESEEEDLAVEVETIEESEDAALSTEEGTQNPEAIAENIPCVLAITMGGFGKRVPAAQFRLQNRAGMGLVAIKFRKANDKLAALRVVNQDDELMIVTSRGIIIRQAVNAISMQSRMATGVRVQRLDEDDAIAAVALVPPTNGDEEESE